MHSVLVTHGGRAFACGSNERGQCGQCGALGGGDGGLSGGLPRPAKLLRPAAIELPRGVRVVAAAAACAFTALEVEADHRSPRREGAASARAERREGVWCAGDASKFCIPGTLEAVGGVHFLPSCYMDDVSTHELSAS